MKRTAFITACIFLSFTLGVNAQDDQDQKKEEWNVQKDSSSVTKDTLKNDSTKAGNWTAQPFMKKHQEMIITMRKKMAPGNMSMMMHMRQNKQMNRDMPMKKYELMVKMIPELKDELTLSNDQLGKLLDIRASFEKQMIDFKLNLEKNKMKLISMLKDEASAEDIRDVLEKSSEWEINLNILAYKTADKMKELLNNDQIKKLDEAVSNSIEGNFSR